MSSSGHNYGLRSLNIGTLEYRKNYFFSKKPLKLAQVTGQVDAHQPGLTPNPQLITNRRV